MGAGALGLAILGAVFVPSWPVQLVCYVSIAVTLLCLAYTALTRRAVHVTRDTIDVSAFAHATIRVGMTIHNPSFLPVALVAVMDHEGGLRSLSPPRTLVSLPPRGSARFGYTLKTMGRGVHELGPVTLAAADPLGLFPWRSTAECRCRITVLPDLGILPPTPRAGSPGGEPGLRDPVFEDTSRFRSVREYVRGDPPPRIHWKITARLGSLHTVVYEPSIVAPCLVVLDLRLDGYPARSRYHLVERAIETAASLVLQAADSRQSVALVSNGVIDEGNPVVGTGKGTGHALEILAVLARICPVDEPVERLLDLCTAVSRPQAGSRLCVVGPEPQASTLQRLREAISPHVEVYRIAGSAESRTPPRGVRVYTIRPYGEVLAGD